LRTRRSDSFTTITVAGQVLPADLLQRIADKDKELGGLGADSYHLSPSETISEATSRAWNKLVSAWANFKSARQKLPPNDPGTTVTRERWLLPLFQELGYGRLPASRSAVEIDGRGYAISHWWSSVPIHLVGVEVSIDKLSARVPGAARSSPHSLVQELLNRSAESLWGFVSNGAQLRILRDNQNLVRQAYVEFDLEAMLEGEAYSDFVMLWLLCHQSRVEAEKPTDYWLEKWSRAAQERGVRALDQLREGVKEAISLLGGGFLAHRANAALKEKLRSGLLSKQDYYRQLLRLVYRLLFLFVAEDRTDEKNRSLLFDPNALPERCERYTDFYSTKKLRHLAERRHGSRHADLYAGLRLVMLKLGSDSGCSELGLPALGSFLFSEDAIADLKHCELENHDLLDAVRALSFTTDNQARRQIDYKNLGSEELGSVYESLLELHPQLNVDAAGFTLATAAGHERKTTGSYYTHDSLVQCLLDSAFDPVVSEREHDFVRLGYESAEAAILDLKVCDPACGSGHFLIAAAHRLAKRLAAIRTTDNEPSPEAVRHALRDIVGRCLYGVDINPMAVELCKVSLWMEALEPGKPLSFLDHHILCGNSLLGTTPALIGDGIPDKAFKPIVGDDPEYCREYKRRNLDERQGQRYLPDAEHKPWRKLGNLASSLVSIDEIADDTLEGVRQRQKRYENIINSSDYRYGGLLADAWCAAFVWKKQKSEELPYPITEEGFRHIEENPLNVPKWMEQEIKRLAARYQFFHWHLAFPGVFRVRSGKGFENDKTGWSGGFDIVLGNPPWEKLQTEELQFFASPSPEIAKLKGVSRKTAIKRLYETNPELASEWHEQKRFDAASITFIRNSEVYPLTGIGKFNTYALFAEKNLSIINRRGRAGFIIQTDIATNDTYKNFFASLLKAKQLVSFYDFVNTELLFPHIHRTHPHFCLLTLSGHAIDQEADFAFWNTNVQHLSDVDRHFNLSADDFALLNPNTLTCPIFRSQRDAAITKSIYRRIPIFFNEKHVEQNAYEPRVWRLINTADDSGKFVSFSADNARNVVPVIEAKTIHQFDHRYATFHGDGGDSSNASEISSAAKSSPDLESTARYYVSESLFKERMPKHLQDRRWFLTARNITNSTNERTVIAAIIPRGASCEHTPYIEVAGGALISAFLVGALNSFALDYVARQKMGGTTLSYFILYQFAIPFPESNSPFGVEFVVPRVLELSSTSHSLEGFAKECGYLAPPFRWDEGRRFMIRCELDAAYFHTYGIERENVDYIMDTFPILEKRDEQQFGEYRTKRVILEIYDEMAQAIGSNTPYQTRLDPPPADPAVAHPPRFQLPPLVLPSPVRYPQPDAGVYMMRVILSMLQQNNGSIDVERLMNACELLAMPDRLETYGSTSEPSLAHQWRSSFNDQFKPDLFLSKIDDLVQRGEIRLTRDGTRFKVARIGTAVLPTDEHIDFDARFALRVNDSLPQAEKDAFTPLATRDQIEERTRAA
jgi:type I restriction-modification system DNA methylase subunit